MSLDDYLENTIAMGLLNTFLQEYKIPEDVDKVKRILSLYRVKIEEEIEGKIEVTEEGAKALLEMVETKINETDRLLPVLGACPFCGKKDELSTSDDDGKYWILCERCFANGPDGKDYDDAAERWNERK